MQIKLKTFKQRRKNLANLIKGGIAIIRSGSEKLGQMIPFIHIDQTVTSSIFLDFQSLTLFLSLWQNH